MMQCSFVYESNFVGLEWIFLALHMGQADKIETWCFYINSLQRIPYLAERIAECKWKTNLGAELLISDKGFISEFSYASQGSRIKQEYVPETTWNDQPTTPQKNKLAYRIPDNAMFICEETIIGSEDCKISGLYRIPKNVNPPYPSVLFISGSGSQDRHGFVKDDLDLGTHKILDYLANNGILVLSIDDRGSGNTVCENYSTEIGLTEITSDARSCLNALSFRSDISKDKIFLLGHSEGAIIAMILAQQSKTAGIILMAPPYRPIDVIMKEQLSNALTRSNYTQDQINTYISEFNEFVYYIKENMPLTARAPLPFLINYKSAKWLREHLQNPPSKIAPFVKCPVAIFCGDKDFQINLEDDGRNLAKILIESRNTKVSFYPLRNVDHLFRLELGKSTPRNYYDTNRPISEEFLDNLVKWIYLQVM